MSQTTPNLTSLNLKLTSLKAWTLAAGLALAIVAFTMPSPARAGTCTPVQTQVLPQEVSSGLWTADGSTLLLADQSLSRVFAYGSEGRFAGVMPNPERTTVKFSPVRLAARDGEIVVEVPTRRLLRLDQSFHLLKTVDTLAPKHQVSALEGMSDNMISAVPSGSGQISIASLALYGFTKNDVIACSDLKTTDGGREDWSTAIVRFPLSNPASFRVFNSAPVSAPEWTFCLLGFPYIATIGDAGFVILLGDQTGLYRSDPGSDELVRLADYPADHLAAPTLPGFSGPDEFAATLKEVNQSTLPVGLYAWSDHLFVLRHVVESGTTKFLLDKVDPDTGAILGTAEIRTEAKELLLIPGNQWAMVEKTDFIYPDIPRIVQIRLIPSSAFGKDFGGVLCK